MKKAPKRRYAVRMLMRFLQFALSSAIGCYVFWALSDNPNPKVPLIGGFLAGLGSVYLLTRLWVLVRYGWAASRTVSFDG